MTAYPYAFALKMGHPRTCDHLAINAIKKEIREWITETGITAPVRIGWYSTVETFMHRRLKNATLHNMGDFTRMQQEYEKAYGQLLIKCADENTLTMIKLRFG